MANREKLRIKSALKRSRQNIKRNELRSPQRAAARTAVKAVSSAIESGDKSNAEKKFKEAVKILDTMVSKIGIFAGGGKLPMIIGKNLIDSRYEVVFFCIDKFK